MVNILRVKTRWSGFNGGPGYTVMHFRDFGVDGTNGADATTAQADAAAQRVLTFFDNIKTHIASTVRLDIESDVDLIEDTNGELISSFGIPTKPQLVGLAAGNYSAASGAVVNWKTAGIRNSRKIRGRTFVVPLGGSAMGPDGALSVTARNAIAAAATTLAGAAGSPDLGIYARPTAKGATDGKWSAVTASAVPSMAAILTSRRD